MNKVPGVIHVTVYTDKDGEPTCAEMFPDKVCIFYRQSAFGTKEHCVFMRHTDELSRRGPEQLGSLIPCNKCKVWYEE